MRLTTYKTLQEKINNNTYIELVKESAHNYAHIEKTISSSESIYDLGKEMGLHKLPVEEVHIFAVSTKLTIIGHVLLSKGAINASIVSPAEVFKPLLLMNAAGFIMIHNHPSGDTTPSTEDINVTKRLNQCAELFGIKLIDHIIISDKDYYSMKSEGII